MNSSNKPTHIQLQSTLDKYEAAMEKVERLWAKMPNDPKIRKDIVEAAADLAQLAPQMEEIKSLIGQKNIVRM